MTDPTPPAQVPVSDDWAIRALDAALAAFAVTTGATLVFATHRDGALAPFAAVGARVSLDVALPPSVQALIGLAVHAGASLVLGALVVLATITWPRMPRVVTALTVVAAYELASRLPWLAVLRADFALSLPGAARAGLVVLLVAALTMRSRGA